MNIQTFPVDGKCSVERHLLSSMQFTPDRKKVRKMSAQIFWIVKIFCLSYRIVAHIARENISLEQREV